MAVRVTGGRQSHLDFGIEVSERTSDSMHCRRDCDVFLIMANWGEEGGDRALELHTVRHGTLVDERRMRESRRAPSCFLARGVWSLELGTLDQEVM